MSPLAHRLSTGQSTDHTTARGRGGGRPWTRVSRILSHVVFSDSDIDKSAETFLAAFSSDVVRPPADTVSVRVRNLQDAMMVSRKMSHSRDALRLGGLAGYKAGWKNAFPEQHSLYGPLFRNGMLPDGAVPLDFFKIFAAEGEFGLVLARDFEPRDEEYSEAEVLASIDHVELCIELCGIRQWSSTDRLHYVADALSGAAVVRGPKLPKAVLTSHGNLTEVRVSLLVDGVEISSGYATSNPHDSPLASAAFIINDLCVRHRTGMQAGALISCGHCCQVAFENRPCPPHVLGTLPVAPSIAGGHLRAVFHGLGEVNAILAD